MDELPSIDAILQRVKDRHLYGREPIFEVFRDELLADRRAVLQLAAKRLADAWVDASVIRKLLQEL